MTLPEGVPLRLYGRRRGHPLRPRQERLLAETLPRLRFDPSQGPLPDPLWLEVGFGGGEHALAQHAAHPEVTLVASEVFENGLCSLLSRLVPDGEEGTAPLPERLFLWPQDARDLIAALPDASLSRLFLMFPDPWPKARHAKRRFVHPAMLPVVARVLKPGAEWRIASDDPTYQDWVMETFRDQRHFEQVSCVALRPECWPPTRYEQKALREGRTPFYWVFQRA
ncbi:tRNA (guanine(46)-N(7))-methyltransferase TrmB [Sabulicella glaciei]|uniref:tRNA (guanine-N(7)-)-methyltransferase n=1 Tax=Sabulicella glaciei TaxID=2984948 RepID=A0ABT3NYG7_9PROT|nr:tRNA (guanine(46)-N(7))-methyltransferase TrmB [Roseococcus sp. MDT2-1-1]MCW8087210.1 tRNA (guanine(46)-N(7))-methyltransferase TrmB [Roseococcus sp. MDT2-1-1]